MGRLFTAMGRLFTVKGRLLTVKGRLFTGINEYEQEYLYLYLSLYLYPCLCLHSSMCNLYQLTRKESYFSITVTKVLISVDNKRILSTTFPYIKTTQRFSFE